jgi:hypothetical protein
LALFSNMKSCEGSGLHVGAQHGGATGSGGNKVKGVKQGVQGGRKAEAGRVDICAYSGKKSHWPESDIRRSMTRRPRLI